MLVLSLCSGVMGPSASHESRVVGQRAGQNHRKVGVGRDLCGSSSPTLLLKQGHLQQAAQDLVQAISAPRTVTLKWTLMPSPMRTCLDSLC